MPQYMPPFRHYEGFESYINLKPDQLEGLLKEIKKVKAGEFPAHIDIRIAKKIGIDEDNAYSICSMIFSLMNTIGLSGDSEKDVVDSLFSESIIERFEIEKPDIIKPNLVSILKTNKSIGISLKARDLATEREKLLTNTRILSDVRPLFFNDPKDMKTSLIIHNLKITYQENNDTKTLYFALDSNDLNRLKEDITRAEVKENTIKENLSETISFIDYK